MDKDLETVRGTSVQEKQDSGRRPRSRSKAAAKLRRSGGSGPGRSDAGQPESSGAGRSRRGRVRHGCRIAAGAVIALVLAACMGGYAYKALGYRNTYLPHTVINGINVSGRTPKEARDMISSGIRSYSLVLKLRDGTSRSVAGADMGLHTQFDGSLEEIIRQQNPYAWPRYLLKGPDYNIQTIIAFDEEALENKLGKLDCFDPANITMPTDAYVSDYVSGQGYSIIPETEGNEPDMERVKTAAAQHVKSLEKEMDLDALGCYKEPSIRAGNSSLVAARDARNHYVNLVVTYTFGSTSQILDGNTIHQWLVSDGGNVSLDHDKIADYVRDLASKYNTAYKKRLFKTSYGQTVEVSGYYGWRINQTAETKELTKILESGKNAEREPVYAQTAASHGAEDYGGTYAEVNLTAQHLFLYKDGEKILESDFVSGNIFKGHTTPPGIFSITYKQKDAILKGQGYASPVKYWMPFNGGIGFHDASWRSSFGGSIYKSGGSHGCVNMPYGTAEQLFQYVYTGMPVICYNLPGTEAARPSKASGSAPRPVRPPAVPAPPAPAPAVPAPPAPAPAAPPSAPAAPLPSDAPSPPAAPAPQDTDAPTKAPVPQGTASSPDSPAPPDSSGSAQPGQEAASQTKPQISIDPVGQTTASPPENTRPPETSAGYGPAFQNVVPGGGNGSDVR